MTNQKVVVIAPHPDDEVIGCGGSIVKHARRGDEVTVVTIGERGRGILEADVSEDAFRAEQERAHATLGVTGQVNLDLPPRKAVSSPDLALALLPVFRSLQPRLVYLPHGDEIDAEHRGAREAVMESLWMAAEPFFEEAGAPTRVAATVLAYEVWTPMRRYQYVEDITGELDVKIAAMRCYESQLRHAPWDAGLAGLARYRGATAIGGGAAEVFAVEQLGRSVLAAGYPRHAD